MRRLVRIGGAGALILGALAPRAVSADGPDVLPREAWWRAEEPVALQRDPLALVGLAGGVAAEAEWWPLYRDGTGARVDGFRRGIRAATPPGRWRAALTWDEGASLARGAGGTARFGAEQERVRRAGAVLARASRRIDVALALSSGAGEPPGWALGASARIAPGWSAAWRLGAAPGRGTLAIGWNEERIAAVASWSERAAEWRLSGPIAFASVGAALESRDRRADAGGESDRAEPGLAWRSGRAWIETTLRSARSRLEVERGAGRQELRVRREGTVYASAGGAVRSETIALSVATAGVRCRAWAGSWHGGLTGSLALWPFAGLAGAAGSRQLASTDAALAHRGLSIDRDDGGRAWDCGVALWSLDARADYRSWRAALFGLGRDAEDGGRAALPAALLGGARLAGRAELAGASWRVEIVQWLPLRVREAREAEGSGGSPPPAGTAGGSGGPARGGTIVRLSVAPAGPGRVTAP